MPTLSPESFNTPQSHLSSMPNVSHPDSHEALSLLVEQLKAVQSVNQQMQAQNQQMQEQLFRLQEQLNERDRTQSVRPARAYQPPVAGSDYSNYVRLGFRALKWLFLFLVGFSIACIVSASLQAPEVVDALISLMSMILAPLIVLTLCIIIGCAVLESVR